MAAPPLRWRRNDRIGPIGDSQLCRAPDSAISGRIWWKADVADTLNLGDYVLYKPTAGGGAGGQCA